MITMNMQFTSVESNLINCSRGPVIDEVALVEHLKENPMFCVGLDGKEPNFFVSSL